MSNTEVSFLLWGCGALLGILSFIGGLAVKQLMRMAGDINDIKVTIARIDTKHDALVERVERLEKEIA